MKLFALVQGGTIIGATALATQNHSFMMGASLYLILTLGYGLPSLTIAIMRRVRRYQKRVAGMQAVREEIFRNQYGAKRRVPATAGRPQTYTIR